MKETKIYFDNEGKAPYPTDCLKILRVGNGFEHYKIIGSDIILHYPTKNKEICLRYIYDVVDWNSFPEPITTLVSYSLADYLAPALKSNATILNNILQKKSILASKLVSNYAQQDDPPRIHLNMAASPLIISRLNEF